MWLVASISLAILSLSVANGQKAIIPIGGLRIREQATVGDPGIRAPNKGICHGVRRRGNVGVVSPGQTIDFPLTNEDPRGGGHCAFFVSDDGEKTFTKLNDQIDCTLRGIHSLKIPDILPAACRTACTLMWFFIPRRSGTCEIYNNCIDIRADNFQPGITSSVTLSENLVCQRTGNNGASATLGTLNPGGARADEAPTPAPTAPDFSRFCQGKVQTIGKQITTGSCSNTPQGDIPARNRMVSTRILEPVEGARIQEGIPFRISVRTNNLDLGFFDDPNNNYYLSPQTLNRNGIIVGHQHAVIQSLNGNEPMDPTVFKFFKGLNDDTNNGTLTVTVDIGISGAGPHRLCTMTGTRGHQPVIMPVAQRGSQDDCIRIEIVRRNGAGGYSNENPLSDNAVKIVGTPPPPAPSPPLVNGAPAFGDICRGKTRTNGLQIVEGSCSSTLQGDLPNRNRMVSTVIIEPSNGAKIPEGTTFRIAVKTNNLDLGFFDDPQTAYYLTPQTLNRNGIIEGHQHVVIQELTGNNVADPTVFKFFRGLNDDTNNGILTTTVDIGLSGPGVHRLCTITGTRGHQPVIMPVAQRGSQDDCIRIEITSNSGAGGYSNENPRIDDVNDCSFRCGTSFLDASNKCGISCPSGNNNQCPSGQTCFRNNLKVCATCSANTSPSSQAVDCADTRRRCLQLCNQRVTTNECSGNARNPTLRCVCSSGQTIASGTNGFPVFRPATQTPSLLLALTPPANSEKVCKAVAPFDEVAGMEEFCNAACTTNAACPATHCDCSLNPALLAQYQAGDFVYAPPAGALIYEPECQIHYANGSESARNVAILYDFLVGQKWLDSLLQINPSITDPDAILPEGTQVLIPGDCQISNDFLVNSSPDTITPTTDSTVNTTVIIAAVVGLALVVGTIIFAVIYVKRNRNRDVHSNDALNPFYNPNFFPSPPGSPRSN